MARIHDSPHELSCGLWVSSSREIVLSHKLICLNHLLSEILVGWCCRIGEESSINGLHICGLPAIPNPRVLGGVEHGKLGGGRTIINTRVSKYTNEPLHGETNNLHRRKQRRRSVTAKLICVFVFATRIVQFLFFLNPTFQASSLLLCLYMLVCV